MSLAKLQQNSQKYQDGLYQTAHCLDSISDSICDILQRLGSVQHDASALVATIQNEVNLSSPISEFEAKAFCQNIQGVFFLSSVLWPLRLSLIYIDSKGKNNPESIVLDNCDFDTEVNSARGLYKLIIQLPESIVLPWLQSICAKNDSYSLMDAFELKDENAFVDAFEKHKNKKSIIDTFVSKANEVALINNILDTFKPNANLTIWDFFKLSQKTILQTCNRPGLELSYRISKDPLRFLFANPSLMENEISLEYKSALLDYLSEKDTFDNFEMNIIEDIIQEPNFIVFTNKLLAECKECIKQEPISEGIPNTLKNDELAPFPFPYNIIQIESKQTKLFLECLYEKLLNSDGKQYLERGRKELFVYLFGGSEEKPNQPIPLIWLRQKNELQAFLLALFGKKAGEDPGWSTFNNYFWWKNEYNDPKLANNSGNISSDIIDRFDNIVNKIKEEIVSNPN